jgi:hypothetical protein
MNRADAHSGTSANKLFEQATRPLRFAVRASRSFQVILTCWQPVSAGDPSAHTKLHVAPTISQTLSSAPSKR